MLALVGCDAMGSASSRGGVGGGSASSDEAIDARKGNQNGGKRKLEEERVETSPKRYSYEVLHVE